MAAKRVQTLQTLRQIEAQRRKKEEKAARLERDIQRSLKFAVRLGLTSSCICNWRRA